MTKARPNKSPANAEGLMLVDVDLSKVTTKNGLFDAFATALSFPSYFGRNWDALNDCLTDLSWLDARGWQLNVSGSAAFERKHPRDFATLLDLLSGASEYWTSQQRTFRVIVPATERAKDR